MTLHSSTVNRPAQLYLDLIKKSENNQKIKNFTLTRQQVTNVITRGQVRSSGPSLVADRDTMALCQGPRTSKGPRASKRPRRAVADCCKKRNHAPCMIFHCFLEHLAVNNTAQDLRHTDEENVGPDLHSLNCTEFGQLLLRMSLKLLPPDVRF